jgi:hypothetical protein
LNWKMGHQNQWLHNRVHCEKCNQISSHHRFPSRLNPRHS